MNYSWGSAAKSQTWPIISDAVVARLEDASQQHNNNNNARIAFQDSLFRAHCLIFLALPLSIEDGPKIRYLLGSEGQYSIKRAVKFRPGGKVAITKPENVIARPSDLTTIKAPCSKQVRCDVGSSEIAF